MSAGDLAAEVEALDGLDLEGLRAAWRRRWGAPPALRSPELLRRMTAWRIQATALGGLAPETRQRLCKKIKVPTAGGLQPGSKLVREWMGRPVEVIVVEDGFAYQGAVYRSLSKVAREVTGTNWNGPRFFGLRGEGADK